MKIYFRILRYAPGLIPRMIQFLIFSILGIIFSVVNLALVLPMLNMLFGIEDDPSKAVKTQPKFTLSLDYIIDSFNFQLTRIVNEHGSMDALVFICLSIVASVILTNAFRY